jgi:hypothetical protein
MLKPSAIERTSRANVILGTSHRVSSKPTSNTLWAHSEEEQMDRVELRTIEENKRRKQMEIDRANQIIAAREKAIADRAALASRQITLVSKVYSAPGVAGEVVLDGLATAPSSDIVPQRSEEGADLVSEEAAPLTPMDLLRLKIENIGQTRHALKSLMSHVASHAKKKILSHWELLEHAFRTSELTEIKLVKGPKRKPVPVVVRYLALSDVVRICCSKEMKVERKELAVLLGQINIPESDLDISRRIAAMRVLLELSFNDQMKSLCESELAQLLRIHKEQLLPLEKLKDVVFPKDESELARLLQTIDKEKSAKRMIEEVERARLLEYEAEMERRRLKSINDFESARKIIQYPKGPLAPQREYLLRSVIEYAAYTVAVQEEVKKSSIEPIIMQNIGFDVFYVSNSEKENRSTVAYINQMIRSSEAQIAEGLGKSDTSDGVKENRSRSVGALATAVRAGTPNQIVNMKSKEKLRIAGVVQKLMGSVALGKGLNGVGFNDVVEMLQAYSSTLIQTNFRCHMKRWRYNSAKRIWRRIFYATKARVFHAWAEDTNKIVMLKKKCWRKIKAWRSFTKSQIKIRAFFRVCFWPFHVWRRYCIASGAVTKKVQFLCGRLLPTYTQLRVFRAWKRFTKNEVHLNQLADGCMKRKASNNILIFFRWYRNWARRRKALRRQWFNRGFSMRRVARDRCTRHFFQIWYSVMELKKAINANIKKGAFAFRNFLLHSIPVQSDRQIIRDPKMDRAEDDSTIASILSQMQSSSSPIKTAKSKTADKFKKNVIRGAKKTKDKKLKSQNSDLSEAKEIIRYGSRKRLIFRSDRDPFLWKMFIPRYDQDDSDSENMNLSEGFEAYRPASAKKVSSRGSSANGTRNTRHSIRATFRDGGSSTHMDSLDAESDQVSGRSQVSEDAGTSTSAGGQDDVKQLTHIPYSKTEWNHFISPIFEQFYTIHDPFNRFEPTSTFSTINDDSVAPLAKLYKRFKYTEYFGLIECAMRFHRMGLRAFRNLRNYAVIRKRARIAIRTRRHAIMRAVLESIIVFRAVVDTNTDSVARQIINETRMLRMAKYVERKELIDQYQSTKIAESEALISRRKSSIMGGIPANSPLATIKNSILREFLNYASTMSTESIDKQRIDLLVTDRQEREIVMKSTSNLFSHGKRVIAMTKFCADVLERSNDVFMKEQAEKFLSLRDIAESQHERTASAIQKEFEFASTFKLYVAGLLVDILNRIKDEFRDAIVKAQLKSNFRILRLPYCIRRSKHMMNRKRLSNWIRICFRLIKVYRHMPKYHKAKKMWSVFNRWLKYFEAARQNSTQDVITEARKRWELRKGFSELLKNRGFELTYCSPFSPKIKKMLNDQRAIFMRWKEYCQDKIIARRVSDMVRFRYKQLLLKKIFGRWKYSALDYSELCRVLANETEQASVLVNRGDIDQIMKRFIIRKRKSFSNRLRALNSGYFFVLKKHAKKTESFKKYIHQFASSIDLRINQESTMLLDSFENRGCITYKDTIHLSPMQKLLKSTRFCDPSYHKYEPVPFGLVVRGGYLLSCIRVAFKRHVGLIGWQLVWDGDGLPTVESKTRGPLSGIAVAVTEFEIKSRDFLMAVEYCCESEEIIAIRFKTFLTGWSKWLGSKPSLTAVTIKLGSDLPDPDPRGSEYHISGKDEAKDPALPSAYIIGLLGMESPNKASCIGVVVRRVMRQNVFSYHWCGEGKETRYFQAPIPVTLEQKHRETSDADSMPLQAAEELISWEDFSREQCIKVAAEMKAKADAEAASKAEADVETAALAEAMHAHLGEEGTGIDDKPDVKERFLPDIVIDSKSSRQGKRSAFGALVGDGQITKASEDETKVKKKDKDDIMDDDDKPISAAEEVFFDILRMRTIELKALQKRSVDFARRLWFKKTLRSNSKAEPQLSMSLQILKALTKWFFESLSKKLSPLCGAEKEFKHIKRELRSLSSKKAQNTFKLASARGSAESHRKSESDQPWFGKSFMGPLERVQRRKFMETLKELEERVLIVEAEIAESTQTEHALLHRLDELAPRIFLCETFCRNIWIKISAAKHKKSLLERMTFDALKDQFSSMPGSKHDDAGLKKYGTPSNGAVGGDMNNFLDILDVIHRRNQHLNDMLSIDSGSRKSMEDDFKREIDDDSLSIMASVTLTDSSKKTKKRLVTVVPKIKRLNTEPSLDDSSYRPPSTALSPKISRSVRRLALPKRGAGGRPITPKRGPLSDNFAGIDDPMNIRRVLAVNTRLIVPERIEEKPASFALKLSQSVKESRNLKGRPVALEMPPAAPTTEIPDEDAQNLLDFQQNYASFIQSLDKDMARLNLLKSGHSDKVSIAHLLEKRIDKK